LHVRTVAAILVWFVVVLLLLNNYLRSEWIFSISIALIILTVLIYFFLGRRK